MLKLEPKKFALRTRYKRSPGMGDTLRVCRENAKIACKNTFSRLSEDALVMRFTRHGGIFRPAVFFRLLNPAPGPAFRSVRRQAIGHAGKIMPSPSVAMSSGRLFFDRDARQQSPEGVKELCSAQSSGECRRREDQVLTLGRVEFCNPVFRDAG